MEHNYTDDLPHSRKEIEAINGRDRKVRMAIEEEKRNPFLGNVVKFGQYNYQPKQKRLEANMLDAVKEILKKSSQSVQEETIKLIETRREIQKKDDDLKEKIHEIFEKSGFQTSGTKQREIAQLLEAQTAQRQQKREIEKRLQEILEINSLQTKVNSAKEQAKGTER